MLRVRGGCAPVTVCYWNLKTTEQNIIVMISNGKAISGFMSFMFTMTSEKVHNFSLE